MKRKLPRLTPRELRLLFAPFPILWLFLGLFVHPAVFRFWVAGQTIGSVSALMLGFVPIIFTLVYGFMVLVVRAIEHPINLLSVTICALCVAFTAFALSPIP